MDLHCGWVGVGGLGLTYLLPAETDGPPLWVGGWGLAGWGSPTCYQRRLMDLHCGWVGGGWRVGAHLLVTSGD